MQATSSSQPVIKFDCKLAVAVLGFGISKDSKYSTSLVLGQAVQNLGKTMAEEADWLLESGLETI